MSAYHADMGSSMSEPCPAAPRTLKCVSLPGVNDSSGKGAYGNTEKMLRAAAPSHGQA